MPERIRFPAGGRRVAESEQVSRNAAPLPPAPPKQAAAKHDPPQPAPTASPQSTSTQTLSGRVQLPPRVTRSSRGAPSIATMLLPVAELPAGSPDRVEPRRGTAVTQGLVSLPHDGRFARGRAKSRSGPHRSGIVPPTVRGDTDELGFRVASSGSGGDLVFHNPGDAPPNTTVDNQGGAIIANPSVQLIFWGSGWSQGTLTPSAGSVVNAVQSILSGPYMSALGQYGVGSAQLRSSIVVTSPQPPNPFSDSDVGNLVWDLIDQGTFPEPDDDGGRILYAVIMPPGVNSSTSGINGEHTTAGDYDFPFDWDTAWVAWVMNDGTLNTVTSVFSHELVEACTDPEGDGWQVNPVNSTNWNEIADVCRSTAFLNGVQVQSYWSQRDQACIIPTGTLPAGGVAGVPKLIQSRFGNQGNFELVTPMASGGLAHYWRNNDDPFMPWFGPYPFGQELGPVDAATLIESNFGSPGNLEVVARAGDALYFFWRDSGPAFQWNGPYALNADGRDVTGVAGNPVLIQSRFGTQGNFELVVPLAHGGLAHYWRDNDDPALPWHGPTVFGGDVGVVGAVTMIESNFGDPGNLEVIVPVGTGLAFFWRDSGPAFQWNGPYPLVFADGEPPFVAGNPVLIQSRFGSMGNFELIDMEASFTRDGGIAHMWRDNDDPSLPWHPSAVFGAGTVVDALAMIESNYGNPGNLEVVARSGSEFVFFWRDSGPVFNWNGPFQMTA